MKSLLKLVTCSLIFLLTTSYNDKCSEPLYYEIDFNDNVTHLWSRKVMYNYDNNVTETLKEVDEKFNDISIDSIHALTAHQNYIHWERVIKFENYVE